MYTDPSLITSLQWVQNTSVTVDLSKKYIWAEVGWTVRDCPYRILVSLFLFVSKNSLTFYMVFYIDPYSALFCFRCIYCPWVKSLKDAVMHSFTRPWPQTALLLYTAWQIPETNLNAFKPNEDKTKILMELGYNSWFWSTFKLDIDSITQSAQLFTQSFVHFRNSVQVRPYLSLHNAKTVVMFFSCLVLIIVVHCLPLCQS